MVEPVGVVGQAAATEETLGRVMSLHSLTVVGFVPIALGVGGALADAAGVTALFVGGAAVEAAACVVGMLFTPVRTATAQSLSPRRAERRSPAAKG